MGQNGWRILFGVGAAGMLIGGPMHPGGTMAEMLADPNWLPGHALVTAGLAALAAGLLIWPRGRVLPPLTRRWLAIAQAAMIVQALDMALHTAAMIDHGHLVAGAATPVLTTHLWATAIVYPLFAMAMIGFIVATARDRTLGSWWIAGLGIVGAAGHGAAGPLVVVLDIPWARLLFPLLVLLAVWFLLVAALPARATDLRPAHVR